MRETVAKTLILLTLILLVALSWLFALLHNREAPAEMPVRVQRSETGPAPSPILAPADEEKPVEDETLELGRAVYNREGCASCHSIAGAGNPRSPLDGTGNRWEPEEIEAWVTGTGFVADLIPAGIGRRKQRYLAIPEADLEALVAFLGSLKTEE